MGHGASEVRKGALSTPPAQPLGEGWGSKPEGAEATRSRFASFPLCVRSALKSPEGWGLPVPRGAASPEG